MDFEVVHRKLEDLRQRGNLLLEEDDAEGAARAYREGIELAEKTEEKDEDVFKLWSTHLLNLSAAELRMGDYANAEKSATEAMKVSGEISVKALYRRAVARRNLAEFEGAYEDLQEAMRIDPREAILREEFGKLKQAYLASQAEEESDDQVVERLQAIGSPELAESVARAAFEPFYLFDSRQTYPDLQTQVEDVDIEGVAITYFGPCASIAVQEGDSMKAITAAQRTDLILPCLDVRIRPNLNSLYAGASALDFRLVFQAEWPAAPPKIRAVSLLAHTWFSGPRRSHNAHHSRRAVPEFYEALIKKLPENKCFSLDLILSELKRSLDETIESNASVTWHRYARQHANRHGIIKEYITKYTHAFPQLFTPPGPALDAIVLDMLSPAIRAALASNNPQTACHLVTTGVWSFDLFSAETAKLFLDEIDAFYASGLPSQRVNSMNRYGVIVSDIGLEPFITTLQRLVCKPIARALFQPSLTAENDSQLGHPAADFDSHHAFIVKYRGDEDPHLDIHTDDADVTFNISLGRAGFIGSNLIFCGMIGAKDHRQHLVSYEHAIGRCVVHLGNRRHGTDDIVSGERLNLIIWNHSLCWRESPDASHHQRNYEEEEAPPDPRCVSYTHDRDFGVFRDYPSLEREKNFRGRGWCPPPGAEYSGFKPE